MELFRRWHQSIRGEAWRHWPREHGAESISSRLNSSGPYSTSGKVWPAECFSECNEVGAVLFRFHVISLIKLFTAETGSNSWVEDKWLIKSEALFLMPGLVNQWHHACCDQRHGEGKGGKLEGPAQGVRSTDSTEEFIRFRAPNFLRRTASQWQFAHKYLTVTEDDKALWFSLRPELPGAAFSVSSPAEPQNQSGFQVPDLTYGWFSVLVPAKPTFHF